MEEKIKGLNNIGNTCYFNSVLQCLMRCQLFRNSLLEVGFNTKYTEKMQNFIKDYFSDETPSTKELYISMLEDKKIPAFAQEDANETLTFLIDKIEEEFSQECFKHGNLFDVKIKNTIKCPECLFTSINTITEKSLILPINEEKDEEFEECYNNLVNDEVLDEENRWTCEKCKNAVKAMKKIDVVETSSYLFISLKRFNQKRKVDKKILMPEKLSVNNQNIYKLTGVIVHYGSTRGGHYVFFGKVNENWYLFNDSSVSPVKNIEDFKNDGYVYLYSKV